MSPFEVAAGVFAGNMLTLVFIVGYRAACKPQNEYPSWVFFAVGAPLIYSGGILYLAH